MSFAFKKFRFFSSAEVPGHAWPPHTTCSAPNKACMACGCENGSIQLLDESFQPLASFAAHGYRVFEVIWLELRNQQLLLSLGSEEPGYSTSTLKLWDVSKLLPQPASATAAAAGPTTSSNGADGFPGSNTAAAAMQPVKAFKVFGPRTSEAEVTSMTAKEGLPAVGSSMSPPAATSASMSSTDGSPAAAVVALGMANGMVYLYTLEAPLPAAPGSKGRPQPLASHHQLPHLPPTKLNARPDPGEDAAVMGLVLLAVPSPTGARLSSLFVVTESQTLSFNLASGTKTILDHQGVRTPHCCVLRSPSQQHQNEHQHSPVQGNSNAVVEGADSLLMVARDEGLYEYTTDTRAGCTVFEGSKQLLLTLGRFVVVVTHEVSGDVGARSATVHILDLKHRLVAGSLSTGSVEAAAAAWGGLAVVQGGGKITILKEVDLTVQLDALFRRSLHKLALDIARAHNADASTIAGIQQKWGDALYDKGEFDLAMAAYKETLHHLEPSYVLRRFLDAQRIHNLTSYLELLHEKGLASADHTTLLLNCYTKLKDVAKLDAFILRSGVPQAAAPRTAPSASASTLTPGGAAAGLKFDAETAVKVLRTAGYHRQALWVAEAAGQADWVLDILMEDLAAYDDALALLEKLPRAHRAFALKRMGQALVTSRPEATTKALMELCCPPAILDSSAQHSQDKGTSFTASVSDFAHLYTRTPTALMLLCEFILNTTASSVSPVSDPQHTSLANEATLYHTLLELYLMEHLVDQEPLGDQQAPGAPSPLEPGQQQQEQQQSKQQSKQQKQQLYSKQAQQQQQQQQSNAPAKAALHDQQVRRGKALDLMASGWPPHLESPKYDAHHVLSLCRLHAFQEGLVFLYDKMRLAREVLQVYMTSGDHAGLIAAVSKYGDACRGGDPQLWADVLQHFVEQPGSSCEPQIVEVVGHIEAGSILPPLVVLQLLAKNRSIKMSSVRQYVSRQLAREMSEAARDREAVTKLSSETQGLRAELHKLKSEAHVFQASRCSATGAPLELPALHFMCGHSFSARALGDGGQECPLCAPELRRVLEIRRNMAATGLQQDRFFTELRESGDGFSVIADHFGRGVMNITPATAASAVAAGSKPSP